MKLVSLPEAPPTILVVDDDQFIRELLRRVMEKEGYKVVEATNGEQGLDVYKRHKPHLVILDALMPVMDGFTCCKHLHKLSDEASPDSENLEENLEENLQAQGLQGVSKTPVLMITNLDDPASVDRALAVGATDYITKPIHLAVLRQRVRRLIQQFQLYQQFEQANRECLRLATLDGLTGVANRRRFDEYLDDEWRRMIREESPLSLILCNIDFFKKYNDTYGHQAGENCLQQVADALRFCVKRSVGLVARYGGEEFAIVLPNTTTIGASLVAEELRSLVHGLKITHAASAVSEYVTLSLGVASLYPEPDTPPAKLVAEADMALYQAKASGRNRYVAKV